MNNEEALSLLSDRQFLDKLYAFAYRNCNTSHEAEDLCSDMILAILKALRQNEEIQHFYAFAWTVAHRAYADHCERKKRENARIIPMEDMGRQAPAARGFPGHSAAAGPGMRITDLSGNSVEEILDEQLEREEQQRRLQEIFREMAFLSWTYRSVMIMYYLEERKISDIADRLGITENTVKQRLFSARRTIRDRMCPDSAAEEEPVSTSPLRRDPSNVAKTDKKMKKECKKMEQNTNRTLQPISLTFIGTGNPTGNDPREKAERILSHNLIYLCKSKAKSAGELARELNVPMPYIEQELEIQCRGVNGQYGMLRRAGQGKYISNILVADREEYLAANEIYSKYASPFCQCLADAIEAGREKISSVRQLGSPKDTRLLLWLLVSRAIWSFDRQVNARLREAFSDTEPVSRPYTCVAIEACANGNSHFYGNDGISAQHICGYSNIYVENLYGDRLQAHFHCNFNISTDPLLLLTVRCVDGLALSALTGEEREIASAAIQCGYLQKNGEILEPAIVVLEPDSEKELMSIFHDPLDGTQSLSQDLAEELAGFMKKHIPAHLMGEYAYYNSCIASNHFFHNVVEECIGREILNAPENPLGPEGVLMVLQK